MQSQQIDDDNGSRHGGNAEEGSTDECEVRDCRDNWDNDAVIKIFEQKFPHGVYKWSSDNDDSKVNSKGTNRSTTGFTASLLSNDCSLSKQPAPNTTQNIRTKFFLTTCSTL